MEPLVLLIFLFNIGTIVAIVVGCLNVLVILENPHILNIPLLICILALIVFRKLRSTALIMLARKEAYCDIEVPEEGYVRLEDGTFLGRNETGGLKITNVEPKDHWDIAGEVMEEHLSKTEKRKRQMNSYYQTHKEQWKIYRKRAREKRKLKSSK